VTRPLGKATVQVTGEVAKTFAGDVERELNKALRGVHVDTAALATKISAGARAGADQSGRALDGLASDVDRAMGRISREATEAFAHTAASGAAAAGKIGASFQLGGEVSERALSELDRTSAREFQQIANKAGAAAASTSTRWVAAWSVIKGAALAAGTAAVAGLTALTAFGLKSAAALEQTQIGLASLLGSADAAKAFSAQLQEFAAATPFQFADVADASRRILAFGSAVGITRDKVIPTLTTIGDLVGVLGGTSENIQSVIRALGQMASKGKVSQEEILQLSEALPGFNSNAAIASALGLSVSDSLKKITAGGVDARTGIDALLTGMAKFPGAAGAMAAQAKTLNGVWSTFKDTIGIALTDAFTPVIPKIKDTLTAVTPIIGDAVKVLAPALGDFLAGVLPLIGEAIKALSPILGVFVRLATTLLAPISRSMQALAPIVERLVVGLQPLAEAIGDALAQAITELVRSGALDELVQLILDMTPATVDLVKSLIPLLPVIAELLTLWLRMQRPGIQLLALLTSLAANKAIGPALRAVADAMASLFRVVDKATTVLLDIRNWPRIFKADLDKVVPSVKKAASAVGGFFAGIGSFLAAIPGKVGSFLASLPGIVGGAFKAAADAALHAIGFGIGLILGELLALPQLIGQAISRIPETVGFVFDAVVAAAAAGLSLLVSTVTTFVQRIPETLSIAWNAITTGVSTALARARDNAIAALSAIVTFALSVPSRISNLAGAMFDAGLAMIKGLFSGLGQAGGFVGDLASRIVAAIKGLLNKVISGINSGIASVDDALPGISLPRLPSLDTGGLTTRSGVANLHPDELVLPLEDRRAIDLLARAMSLATTGSANTAATPVGAGTPAFDVRVFIGQTELTQLVDTQITERNRTTKARVLAGTGRR